MTARRQALLSSCACFAFALAFAGCSEDPLTQLVVVVDSDSDSFERVEIDVDHFGDDMPVKIEPRRGRPLLPRRLALVHEGGALGPFSVTARGFVAGSDDPRLVEPRSDLYFVRGKTRMLKIDLLYDCIDECPGRACIAGPECVESDDPRANGLTEWDGKVDPLDVMHHGGGTVDGGPDASGVPGSDAGPDGGGDPRDGGDSAVEPGDADAERPPVLDFPYSPSNFDPEHRDVMQAVREDVALDCGPSRFDSSSLVFTGCDSGEPTPVVLEQGDGSEVVVLASADLTIAEGSSLQLVGDRPVILAVFGDARIAGTIDASAQGALPGPGADRDCILGTGAAGGAANAYSGAGGGGGGGFGSAGGDGGQGGDGADVAADAAVGGGIDGNASLVPLRGGCSGGGGGAIAGAEGGAGGGGGGAVQISAAGTLTLSGTINAAGGGGAAASTGRGGGGGGGSGGAIALEAETLDIAGSALLSANGGAGAAGQSATPAPAAANGADGASGTAAALGGGGQDYGGDGGDGAAANAAAAAGGDGSSGALNGGGGGGGGGGTGRIGVRRADACAVPGVWSPLATVECVDCGSCTSEPPASDCEPFAHDGRVYYHCTSTLDWEEANATCAAANQHLVRIDDQAENDAVAAVVGEDTFIGASDEATEGDWHWSDGTAFWSGDFDGSAVGGLYNAWALDQPDNAFAPLTNADCAIIGVDGLWTDRSCIISHPYVCEP